MAEKNLAAFLRGDVKSVSVKFWKDRVETFEDDAAVALGVKEYTYLTTIADIKEGDDVVVLVSQVPRVVRVIRVHETLEIEPNDIKEYRYIVDRVDYAPYLALLAENTTIKKQVASAYQKSVRTAFKDQILGVLPTNERLALEAKLRETLNEKV